MSRSSDQPYPGHDPKRGRAGAKEILTLEVARRIGRMIELFPDSGIEVTWNNVVRHTKLRFGHELRRNVLSQKSWDGRKLIADAFHDAKEIQRRRARDAAPRYAKEPRVRLLLLVEKLQSDLLALRAQLAQVRAAQYDEIHALLDTRTPLHRLVDLRSEAAQTSNEAATRSSPHGGSKS